MRCTDRRPSENERGAALGIAIFALAVIGGLVTASFPGGLLEQQSGRNTLYFNQAAEAAEGELGNAVVSLSADPLRLLVSGGAPLDLGSSTPAAGLIVERQVFRLTDSLFLIQARAMRIDADGTPLASRKLGLLTTLSVDSAAGALLRIKERAWVQLY